MKKNNKGKFYYMHWNFMERKVEIRNKYYIFLTRASAEKKLNKLIMGVRK